MAAGVLILGCGALGTAVAELLAAAGTVVVGVRRSPSPEPVLEACRIIRGDIADAAWWAAAPMACTAAGSAWPPQAVLLCANPGVRRGHDNRLPEAAALAVAALPPTSRLVYTGTTAVYADAGGASVDEEGAVAEDEPAIARLLAVERAVLAHPRALVLRIPALVGPTRTHSRERLAAGERTVRGDLDRPFPFLHEHDARDLVVAALGGDLGTGILNAASPHRITVREYYAAIAKAAGVPMPDGDGRPAPSRWIDSTRLLRGTPGRRWRPFEE